MHCMNFKKILPEKSKFFYPERLFEVQFLDNQHKILKHVFSKTHPPQLSE